MASLSRREALIQWGRIGGQAIGTGVGIAAAGSVIPDGRKFIQSLTDMAVSASVGDAPAGNQNGRAELRPSSEGHFNLSQVETCYLPPEFIRDCNAKIEALGLSKVISSVVVLPDTDSTFNLDLEKTYHLDQLYQDPAYNPITFRADSNRDGAVTMLVANTNEQNVQRFMHEVTHVLAGIFRTVQGSRIAPQATQAFFRVEEDLMNFQRLEMGANPHNASKMYSQYERDVWTSRCRFVATKIPDVSDNRLKSILPDYSNWVRSIGMSQINDKGLLAQYLMIRVLSDDNAVRRYIYQISRHIDIKKEAKEVTRDLLDEGMAELFANYHVYAPAINTVPQAIVSQLSTIKLR